MAGEGGIAALGVDFEGCLSSFVMFFDDFFVFLGSSDSLESLFDFDPEISAFSAFALAPFGFDLGIVVAKSSLWSFEGGLSLRKAFGETAVGRILTPPNSPFLRSYIFDGQ